MANAEPGRIDRNLFPAAMAIEAQAFAVARLIVHSCICCHMNRSFVRSLLEPHRLIPGHSTQLPVFYVCRPPTRGKWSLLWAPPSGSSPEPWPDRLHLQ
eukprot:2314386-Pleurochrysis_carterae.AAC.2